MIVLWVVLKLRCPTLLIDVDLTCAHMLRWLCWVGCNHLCIAYLVWFKQPGFALFSCETTALLHGLGKDSLGYIRIYAHVLCLIGTFLIDLIFCSNGPTEEFFARLILDSVKLNSGVQIAAEWLVHVHGCSHCWRNSCMTDCSQITLSRWCLMLLSCRMHPSLQSWTQVCRSQWKGCIMFMVAVLIDAIPLGFAQAVMADCNGISSSRWCLEVGSRTTQLEQSDSRRWCGEPCLCEGWGVCSFHVKCVASVSNWIRWLVHVHGHATLPGSSLALAN